MNFKAQPYQFYVFSRSESFLDIQILVDHLFVTVAAFWMPYLFIGSFMYLVIAGVIIRQITESMTKPFIELNERIRLNVVNLNK